MRFILCLLASLNVLPCVAGQFVSLDSTWRYRKGTNEASLHDTTAWRQVGFNDSAWLTGQAAFYYESQPTNE